MAGSIQQTGPVIEAVAAGEQDVQVSRMAVFLHACAFVFGFGLIFTLMGTAAGLIGQNLNQYLPTVQRIGAIVLLIFALTTLGVFRWLIGLVHKSTDVSQNPAAAALVSVLDFPNTLLYTERRMTEMHHVNRGWGYFSSVLMGIAFAAGWTPCVGPILASIWLLASDTATVAQGALLLALYSLGLGIPFLLTGAMFSQMSGVIRNLNRYVGIISIISGLFMLYVAWLLWSDSLSLLAGQFFFLNEWVFLAEEWIGAVSGTGGDLLSTGLLTSALLSFSAGLISFLSPCVLPLVPAYIGFLSGAALSSRPVER